jgi:hypothetical protein
LWKVEKGTSSPNSLIDCGAAAARTAISGKLNPLEKTTFYDFRVSDVYKCPVLGARRNDYSVSEVKDRRDRSNELYEQVAALG